jgi:hypothetical protein
VQDADVPGALPILHSRRQSKGDKPYNFGQLNLFITSDISEKPKFQRDRFEGGPDNI